VAYFEHHLDAFAPPKSWTAALATAAKLDSPLKEVNRSGERPSFEPAAGLSTLVHDEKSESQAFEERLRRVRWSLCEFYPSTALTVRVAGFFLVHDTKTGKNVPNEHKNTKW
jgi:hypothetical protein